MKTIKILTYVVFALFLGLVTSSCGSDGAEGPAGSAGTNGTDGNANVSIISLSTSDITWTTGSFLGTAANTFTLTDNRVNSDIIDYGAVLGYSRINDEWYALPFTWSSNTSSQYIFHTYALDTITLYAYSTDGVLNPSALEEYRFMLITDNTVTATSSARPAKTKQKIQDELKAAGVDINDYYAVMDYYGLDTE